MNTTDIAEAVAKLAGQIEQEPSVVRIWALASFASALDLDAIITAATDPVDATVDVGEMWADQVAQVLDEVPARREAVVRAAHEVVARLLGVLSTGRQARL